MKSLVLLGSTGSIGRQTLEVVKKHKRAFRVVGMSCVSQVELFEKQVVEWKPSVVGVGDEMQKKVLKKKFPGLKIMVGADGLASLARMREADVVMNGIAGSAGLIPAFAALQAGKTLALANKESMVIAGKLLMEEAQKNSSHGARKRDNGAQIIPVDSELSAIFQLLHNRPNGKVKKIILPASGGPFFGKTRRELQRVTKEQALSHPVWKMGAKVTVDSATLMNKAFELIEAHHLFGVPSGKIEIVIHPEALVHALVQFENGEICAFVSKPDMRLAIEHALFFPRVIRQPARIIRIKKPKTALSARALAQRKFPELRKFHFFEAKKMMEGPALARKTLAAGGNFTERLSYADEMAVTQFLRGHIGFLDIFKVLKNSL